MAKKTLPDQDTLLQLLRYEPDTGKLFWRKRGVEWFNDGIQSASHSRNRWNSRFAGTEAFSCVNNKGYKHGPILYVRALSHRVIWKMVTGETPIEIDHINGDRTDNRLANLRNVTSAENSRNRKIRSNNTSGIVGVRWTNDGRWHSQIKTGGKTFHLGSFECFARAVSARRAAERKYGFHVNHGRAQ